MDDEYLIGIDVGTTSVKATVYTVSGAVFEHRATSYPTLYPGGALVEQNPDDWASACLTLLRAFSHSVPLNSVRAIGLTSQVNTHVFTDASFNALAPAIVWKDGRAAQSAAAIDSQVEEADRLSWWGAPLPVDASHALSRMQWMMEEQQTLWDKTRHVLLPKDYCLRALTGELASDPWSNIGLVDSNLDYIPSLLKLVPGAMERLPPLQDCTTVVGEVLPGLPFAGVPVANGTMDAWAGVLGTGSTKNGDAMYLSGTSEILGIVSESINPTPGVLVMPKDHNITLHVGPTQSGGASQLWLCDLFETEPDVISKLAATHNPASPTPLFLPHLQGERAPLWDASSRGVFLGLDGSTDRAALAYSVYEGVACSARLLLDSLQQSAGIHPERLVVGGGGCRSDVWNQIRADVLQVELCRVTATDPGTLGAAGIAAVAVGIHGSLQTAFENLVQFDQHYEPATQHADRVRERMDLYRDTYTQTKELSRQWLTAFQ